MAITFLRAPKKSKIGVVELDATAREVHTVDVEVTQHPVEKGAAISDHKRRKPKTLQIEGIVTNTPIATPENLDPGADARADNAYRELIEAADSEELLTVVTGLETYENMAIVSLVMPRNASTGECLHFTAALQEIRIVESKTIELVETDTPAGQPMQHKGKQATKQADAAVENKSLLKKGADTGIGDGLLKTLGAR